MHFTNANSHFRFDILFFQNFDSKFEISYHISFFDDIITDFKTNSATYNHRDIIDRGDMP